MAKTQQVNHSRLPRTFHRTFIPERRFINSMLKYAAAGKSGDIQEIAQATGVPTGTSSGKVAPTIDYCRGMGLLTLQATRSAVKEPGLTPFGRVVLLEDPFLKEEITQWLSHLNLCAEAGGAEVWYQTFWNGAVRLGPAFSRDELESWLANVLSIKPGGFVGPMVRMYQEEASFAKCGALLENGKQLSRCKMPVRSEFAWGCAAWILTALERTVKSGEQATMPQLENACGWNRLTGWSLEDAERVLEFVQRKGAIAVDRHMQPWILKAKMSANEAWRQIYDDMI